MPSRSPRTVCVTGMHRSGTSVAARGLEALGVDFGDAAALMEPGPDNESGYWENRHIKEFDDDLFAHLGGSWDRPPVLAPGWEHGPGLAEFRARAATLLDDAFGSPDERARTIGWKDPRLSLLLPFWRTVIEVDATVLVVRHPEEVASSLARRNGLEPATSHVLWLRYTIAATTDDPDAIIVGYDQLLAEPDTSMRKMAGRLGLDQPGAEAIKVVSDHVDPTLRHHIRPSAPMLGEDPLGMLARRVWNDGSPDLDILDADVRHALGQGWLRPPVDTEALDLARARAEDLTNLLRQRTRQRLREVADRDRDVEPIRAHEQ
jgi:hypothetical protein